MPTHPIVIVGAGLSGLASAVLLAQRGERVVVLERSASLGGRGRSPAVGPLPMNMGAHALYRGGVAERTVRACGVVPTGFTPPLDGMVLTRTGEVLPAPTGTASLLWSSWLPFAAKASLVRALASLGREARRAGPTLSWQAWLQREASPEAAAVVGMLARVATYADAPALLAAGPVLAQLERAVSRGVTYVDGGWTVLVDALAARARALGVEVRVETPVRRVEDGGRAVTLGDGAVLPARATVLAVPLHAAAALAALPVLQAWEASAVPSRVCTWDAVVTRLPSPGRRLAQGLDTPTYFSVHSRPGDTPLRVHAHWVLRPGEKGADVVPALWRWLDVVQPDLRAQVVAERTLPELLVADALPTPQDDGRPPVQLGPALFAAADYAQPGAFLLDAALGAAQSVVQQLTSTAQRRSA